MSARVWKLIMQTTPTEDLHLPRDTQVTLLTVQPVLQERRNFDSVGPAPDVVGWTPAIPGPGSSANPSYCPGAKPDSGRFSQPRSPRPCPQTP